MFTLIVGIQLSETTLSLKNNEYAVYKGEQNLSIKDFANELCIFLTNIPEVKSCSLYGSLSKGTYDEYSDIDIAIDVSGIDNGLFIMKLPELLARKYDIIF